MSDATRTWRSIAIAALISAGVVGLAIAGSVTLFVYRHHDSQVVSTTAAADEFNRARAIFAGQQPLVEVRDGDDSIVHRTDAAPKAVDRPAVQTLHTVIFEARSGRLVRINLPFQVARLMHSSGFTYLGEFAFLEDTEFDGDRVLLTLDDLERLGRGLVVDHRHPGGGQFLVWVD